MKEEYHYQIFVYSYNPALEDNPNTEEIDQLEGADHKFSADNKRQLIGILTTIVDNMNAEHISIFKVKEEAQELTEEDIEYNLNVRDMRK